MCGNLYSLVSATKIWIFYSFSSYIAIPILIRKIKVGKLPSIYLLYKSECMSKFILISKNEMSAMNKLMINK